MLASAAGRRPKGGKHGGGSEVRTDKDNALGQKAKEPIGKVERATTHEIDKSRVADWLGD
jgi:hypothetical protein